MLDADTYTFRNKNKGEVRTEKNMVGDSWEVWEWWTDLVIEITHGTSVPGAQTKIVHD